MNEIKSLADELREKIRSGEEGAKAKNAGKKIIRKDTCHPTLEKLFKDIHAHQLTGHEKLLIRLDDRTTFLLKQLKVSKGIDMNKIISYSIKAFLENNPELTTYIKDSLKNLEL